MVEVEVEVEAQDPAARAPSAREPEEEEPWRPRPATDRLPPGARPAWARPAVAEAAAGLPDVVVRLARDAAERAWPCDPRELEQLVRRAVEHALAELEPRGRAQPPRRLELLERDEIERALEATNGNRAHAARLLGLSVRTLFNRLRRYREDGLEVHEPARSASA